MIDLKAQAQAEIARHRDSLFKLNCLLHDNPEIAMQEYQAQSCLTNKLMSHGFAIERGFAGLPTAFRASYGQSRPRLAFLAEYDALPGLGHACGHNLIATAAVAAAIGTRAAIDALGGTVLVIGTPAEELEGGKIIMVSRGAFDDVDVAMMMHPSAHDSATIKALACIALEVEFFGKEAHAAAHPELGINALEAMILSFNAINALRQHIHPDARIHGVIIDGGLAANIVPKHSTGRFLVRSDDIDYLQELKEKVLRCFQGAAIATGARLEYRWIEKGFYAPMRNNRMLANLYVDNMAILGHVVPFFNSEQSFGSTDMGNVSQTVPAIHTSAAIATPGVSEHTEEFARLAGDQKSFQVMMEAATALALTAIDLLSQPIKLAGVRAEFTAPQTKLG
jgi:amidohydrolase